MLLLLLLLLLLIWPSRDVHIAALCLPVYLSGLGIDWPRYFFSSSSSFSSFSRRTCYHVYTLLAAKIWLLEQNERREGEEEEELGHVLNIKIGELAAAN